MVYKQFYPVLKRTANRILAGQSCVFCQLPTLKNSICDTCTKSIKNTYQRCFQCGVSITSTINQQRCGDCSQKPKPYHRLVTACHYDFPVNQAIGRFKFNRQLHLGKALSQLLTQTIQESYQDEPLPELILPIPLHPKRLTERNFNQSQLIAKSINSALQIPFSANHLQRIKNTPHQIGLKAIERRKNLKNAFIIKKSLPKHIVLVDDVVTTGTTITEASKICLKRGAERVDIWCLAKT